MVSALIDETIMQRIIPPKANARKPISDDSNDSPIILRQMVTSFFLYSSFHRKTSERKRPNIRPMARNEATFDVHIWRR